MTKIFRQGDVALRRVNKDTKGLKKVGEGSRVLAYGEATGHHHTLSGEGVVYYEDDNGLLLTQITGSASLVHQEHDAHTTKDFPPGLYEVHLQKEMSLIGELQRVRD